MSMALTATKTPTGYIVEGTDAVGKDVEIFFDSNQSRNFTYLSEVVDSFHKQAEYEEGMAKIAESDPERQLLVKIFGKGEESKDQVLHTTLAEAQEAQNGVELDWSQDPVTTVLRLITTGNSNRLRLFAGNLVDMGSAPKRKAPAKKAAAKKA